MRNNRSPLILAVEQNLREIESSRPWPTWKNVAVCLFFGVVFGLMFGLSL
jgi:hypothetical protein